MYKMGKVMFKNVHKKKKAVDLKCWSINTIEETKISVARFEIVQL